VPPLSGLRALLLPPPHLDETQAGFGSDRYLLLSQSAPSIEVRGSVATPTPIDLDASTIGQPVVMGRINRAALPRPWHNGSSLPGVDDSGACDNGLGSPLGLDGGGATPTGGDAGASSIRLLGISERQLNHQSPPRGHDMPPREPGLAEIHRDVAEIHRDMAGSPSKDELELVHRLERVTNEGMHVAQKLRHTASTLSKTPLASLRSPMLLRSVSSYEARLVGLEAHRQRLVSQLPPPRTSTRLVKPQHQGAREACHRSIAHGHVTFATRTEEPPP